MKLFYDNRLIKMKQETQSWQQHKPVIPAFRRPRQENHGLIFTDWPQSGLYNDSLKKEEE